MNILHTVMPACYQLSHPCFDCPWLGRCLIGVLPNPNRLDAPALEGSKKELPAAEICFVHSFCKCDEIHEKGKTSKFLKQN